MTASGSGPAPPELPAGRRAVLYALRRRGDASVEEIAAQLAMTESGARQHLNALIADGLVEATETEPPTPRRGRRTIRYAAAAAAEVFFPKAYSELTNELLGYVSERDPDLLAAIFAERGRHRVEAARARLDPIPNLGGKVAALTRILDEDGYLASCGDLGTGTGAYRIVEHNYAIWAVAQRYGHTCSSEIEFIRAVLPHSDVTRVEHMVAGARRCAYEIAALADTP